MLASPALLSSCAGRKARIWNLAGGGDSTHFLGGYICNGSIIRSLACECRGGASRKLWTSKVLLSWSGQLPSYCRQGCTQTGNWTHFSGGCSSAGSPFRSSQNWTGNFNFQTGHFSGQRCSFRRSGALL